jgi:hypothetical protein
VKGPTQPERILGLCRRPAPDECWEWLAWKDRAGYGRLTYTTATGERKTGALAHRAAYEILVGPIPDGMTVDHVCFNTSCVNPDHLRPLSRAENARRQRSAAATHCAHGHRFTPENTYRQPGTTRRQCRKCTADRQRRYQATL